MSFNLLITVIIVISFVLMYMYSSSLIEKQVETFENLPVENKIELTSAIRKDNDLESQLENISSQITKREEHYKAIERQYMKDGNDLIKETEALQNLTNNPPADQINEAVENQPKPIEQLPSAPKTATVDMSDYIHKSDIPDMSKYIKKSVLKKYVKRSNVPDMNKYILRSQVPTPPDMNKYILRSQVPKCPKQPDMKQYIRKTEIPAPRRCPDLDKFVLKTSVPPCHKPVCPKPVCPKPNCVKCEGAPVISEEEIIENIMEEKAEKLADKAANVKKDKKEGKNKSKKELSESQVVQTINLPKKFFKQASDIKQKQIENDKNLEKNEKKEQIQKMIDQYKPKVEEKKCTFFRRIIKNADVYGAY